MVLAWKEPTSEELVSWDTGADRRWMTFKDLVENGTPQGTWAYDSVRNRYTHADKKAYYENLERGQRRERASGSGGQRRDEAQRPRR